MKLGLPQRRKGAENFTLLLSQRHQGAKDFKFFAKKYFDCFKLCQLSTANCQLILYLSLFTFHLSLISSCQKKQEWQWSEVKQLSQYEISDLKRINYSTIIGVGGDRYFKGEFYLSNDNGVTWNSKAILDKQLYGISFLNQDTFFASGLDGKLLQSTNAGADWNIIQNFTWLPIRNVNYLNDSTIIFCGGSGFSGGVLIRSTDGGANWKTDTLVSELRGICNTDEQTVYCCGYGKILKSIDAGETWLQQKAEGDFFISIAFASHKHGIAIGLQGTILLTDDGGGHWKKIRNGNSLTNQSWNFRRIIFRDLNKAYIIGDNGIFLFTNDGGTHWIKIKNSESENFSSIVLTNNGGIIGTSNGKLFQFLEN